TVSCPLCARPGPAGTLLPRFGHRPSTSLPPFPRGGFASRPSRRHRRHRYYEGSDSCRSHPDRQVSPLTPPCRPGIPTSTTRAVRRSLCQPHQRRRLLPGFALNEQARHGITPNQVRNTKECPVTYCRPCLSFFLGVGRSGDPLPILLICLWCFVRSWTAVLRPVACGQVPGALGSRQGTETLAQLGGMPP